MHYQLMCTPWYIFRKYCNGRGETSMNVWEVNNTNLRKTKILWFYFLESVQILYLNWIPCQQWLSLILTIWSMLFCIQIRIVGLWKIREKVYSLVKCFLLTLVKLLIQSWFNWKWYNLDLIWLLIKEEFNFTSILNAY